MKRKKPWESFFGLVPENEPLSRMIQRMWFTAPIFWPVLFLLGPEAAPVWGSRLLFGLLLFLFFRDGLLGWQWPKRWCLLLGGCYAVISATVRIGFLSPHGSEQWTIFLVAFCFVSALICGWCFLLLGPAFLETGGNLYFLGEELAFWLLFPLFLCACLFAAWLLGQGLRKKEKVFMFKKI